MIDYTWLTMYRVVYLNMLFWAAGSMPADRARRACSMASARLLFDAFHATATPSGGYEAMRDSVWEQKLLWYPEYVQSGESLPAPMLSPLTQTEIYQLAELQKLARTAKLVLNLSTDQCIDLCDCLASFDPINIKRLPLSQENLHTALFGAVVEELVAYLQPGGHTDHDDCYAAGNYAEGEYHRAMGAAHRTRAATEESDHGSESSEVHDRGHSHQTWTDREMAGQWSLWHPAVGEDQRSDHRSPDF